MDARRAAKDQKDHVAPTHVASSVRGTLIRDGHGTDCIMGTGSSASKRGGRDKYRGETWKLLHCSSMLRVFRSRNFRSVYFRPRKGVHLAWWTARLALISKMGRGDDERGRKAIRIYIRLTGVAAVTAKRLLCLT